MTKIELRKEWATRVTEFNASGQTATAWCSANNLKFHQLKYWLGRQKKLAVPAATPARWLAVEMSASKATPPQHPLLIKVGKATIEISPGFDPELLADAVQALARSC